MECGHMIFTLEQEIDYSEGLDRYSAYMHVLNRNRKKKVKHEELVQNEH